MFVFQVQASPTGKTPYPYWRDPKVYEAALQTAKDWIAQGKVKWGDLTKQGGQAALEFLVANIIALDEKYGGYTDLTITPKLAQQYLDKAKETMEKLGLLDQHLANGFGFHEAAIMLWIVPLAYRGQEYVDDFTDKAKAMKLEDAYNYVTSKSAASEMKGAGGQSRTNYGYLAERIKGSAAAVKPVMPVAKKEDQKKDAVRTEADKAIPDKKNEQKDKDQKKDVAQTDAEKKEADKAIPDKTKDEQKGSKSDEKPPTGEGTSERLINRVAGALERPSAKDTELISNFVKSKDAKGEFGTTVGGPSAKLPASAFIMNSVPKSTSSAATNLGTDKKEADKTNASKKEADKTNASKKEADKTNASKKEADKAKAAGEAAYANLKSSPEFLAANSIFKIDTRLAKDKFDIELRKKIAGLSDLDCYKGQDTAALKNTYIGIVKPDGTYDAKLILRLSGEYVQPKDPKNPVFGSVQEAVAYQYLAEMKVRDKNDPKQPPQKTLFDDYSNFAMDLTNNKTKFTNVDLVIRELGRMMMADGKEITLANLEEEFKKLQAVPTQDSKKAQVADKIKLSQDTIHKTDSIPGGKKVLAPVKVTGAQKSFENFDQMKKNESILAEVNNYSDTTLVWGTLNHYYQIKSNGKPASHKVEFNEAGVKSNIANAADVNGWKLKPK